MLGSAILPSELRAPEPQPQPILRLSQSRPTPGIRPMHSTSRTYTSRQSVAPPKRQQEHDYHESPSPHPSKSRRVDRPTQPLCGEGLSVALPLYGEGLSIVAVLPQTTWIPAPSMVGSTSASPLALDIEARRSLQRCPWPRQSTKGFRSRPCRKRFTRHSPTSFLL